MLAGPDWVARGLARWVVQFAKEQGTGVLGGSRTKLSETLVPQRRRVAAAGGNYRRENGFGENARRRCAKNCPRLPKRNGGKPWLS